MFKSLLQKSILIVLAICINMFILSNTSLLHIKASISEPITPNGNYVPYISITTEISESKKNEYITDENIYVSHGAIRLDEPTNKYNSHSYAWYNQQYNSNIYKINSPNAYISDGSYKLKTDGIEVGDIVCYYRVKLSYDDNRTQLTSVEPYLAHSAKVKSIDGDFNVYDLESLENLTLISKWGDGGLYEHSGTNCPYYYDCLQTNPYTIDDLHFENMDDLGTDDALFYIEVYGPNYENSVSIEMSENPILLSKNLQADGFIFYRLNVQYDGNFEIETFSDSLVDLKLFSKDLNLINDDAITQTDGSTKLVTTLLSNTYYLRISFLDEEEYGNVLTSIKRIITNNPNNENVIIADKNNTVQCGSEVTINGGAYGGNTLTQGFTRNLYLNPEIAPSISRLDYYWYSSDTNVATISQYGTLFAKDGTGNKSIEIIAVYKNNPSIVYKKNFIIKEEIKTEEIIIEYEMTIPINSVTSIELDNQVPYNWIQYYTWSTENSAIATISSYGTIRGLGRGQTTFTGIYEYNTRISILVTIYVI